MSNSSFIMWANLKELSGKSYSDGLRIFIDFTDGKLVMVKGGSKVHEISTEPFLILKGYDKPFCGGKIESIDIISEACLKITYKDEFLTKTACIEFTDGYLKYYCEILSEKKVDLLEVSYGRDRLCSIETDGLMTGELFCWSPDINCTLIPKNGRISVGLSSYEIRDMNLIKGDGGRFIIPPYVAGIKTGNVWLGIGTVEIPRSRQGLQPVVENGDLSLRFEFKRNLVCNTNMEILRMPQVIFFVAFDTDEVISKYNSYIFSKGIARDPVQWEDWWGGPLYCTIGDQIYEAMLQTGNASEMGCENYINEEFTDEMLGIFEKKDIPIRMLVFDAGWMKNMAMFDVHEERFPKFREYMDNIRKRGIRSILWMSPYDTDFFMTGKCEYIYKNHPYWCVRDEEGKTVPLLDYTHPEVREFMKSRVKYMLSDEDGCLNADGLKVDFYYHIPDPGFMFYDPSWGTGELMQYKVLKLIYDAAKEAKREAFIECSSANPLFNDIQDACRLNDDVTNCIDTYEKRAWITVRSKCNIPDTDDWWSFKKYFVRLTLEKCIFGIPALYAIKYRGEQGHLLLGYSGVAPGGNPVNISEVEYKRVSSILKVYSNCPVNISHERFMDMDNKVFYRIHTQGMLKGFYAAKGLNYNTALLTFSEKEARLCSITDTTVEFPVFEGMRNIKILKITGERSEGITFEKIGNLIKLNVEDSGKEGVYYIIEYELKG